MLGPELLGGLERQALDEQRAGYLSKGHQVLCSPRTVNCHQVLQGGDPKGQLETPAETGLWRPT